MLTEPGKKPSDRSAVTILLVVAAFLFFATAAATVSGLSLLFPAPMWVPLWNLNPHARQVFAGIGPAAGALLLTLGVLTCAAAVGLVRHKRWAWIAAVTLFAINGAGDALTLLLTHDVLRGGSGIVIAAVFLILLTRPRVRCVLE